MVKQTTTYEMVDMRRDLVLMCHHNAQHPGLGRTLAALRSVAQWSTMAGKEDRDSVQKRIRMCAHCISVSEKAAEHGLGIDNVRRADVIQIDNFILEDDQKELAGCMGALSIVDVATWFVVYADAHGQTALETALETAVLLLIHWVPYFGILVLIISDPHSGFASEVMAELHRIVGVKERELSAARAKGKGAIVKRSRADFSLNSASRMDFERFPDAFELRHAEKKPRGREWQNSPGGAVVRAESRDREAVGNCNR